LGINPTPYRIWIFGVCCSRPESGDSRHLVQVILKNPSISALANTDEEEVQLLWKSFSFHGSGLGYSEKFAREPLPWKPAQDAQRGMTKIYWAICQ